MRTVLAAAAAGALIMGSAAGAAVAKGKPVTTPAPQTTVALQSVSIKGHKTIDVNKLTDRAAIKLRATIRDPKNVVTAPVIVTLAIYDKKVNGTIVDGTRSGPITLLKTEKKAKKSKYYAGFGFLMPTLPTKPIWSSDQIKSLKAELAKKENKKFYACIETATTDPLVTKYSMQVQKRLADKDPTPGVQTVKKPVRDCVKVIDSNTTS